MLLGHQLHPGWHLIFQVLVCELLVVVDVELDINIRVENAKPGVSSIVLPLQDDQIWNVAHLPVLVSDVEPFYFVVESDGEYEIFFPFPQFSLE